LKLKLRQITIILLLTLSAAGALVSFSSPASGILGVAIITTPAPSTSTTYTNTVTSVLSTTTSPYSTTTSTSATSTSTTTTSTSTSFSYTLTITSTTTTTSYSTSITSTQTSTSASLVTTPTTGYQTTTETSTHKISTVPLCPVALVAAGSALEPYADSLRGFRNNQILNTYAGHQFMDAFNWWYYGWAPSVAWTAASNHWFAEGLRVGLYPLFGILYAAYFSYLAVAPVSPEAGAVIAGIVAASLIGLVYVAPVAYVSARLLRLHKRLLSLRRTNLAPIAMWTMASGLMILAAYVSSSAALMGLSTASLTLSALSLGSLLGAKGIGRIQLPITNFSTLTLAMRRLIQM
jgi:hypothetical protein